MALNVDTLANLLQKGFARAAITTAAGLQDDDKVRSAARNVYDFIPFPVNIAVKMGVGMEGLERFALNFRDKLLAAGITDLSELSADDLRALLQKSIAASPKLSKFLASAGNGKNPPDQNNAQAQVEAPETTPGKIAERDLQGPVAPQPPNDTKIWYLMKGETRYGPWTDTEFLSIAQKGGLGPDDKVWRAGFQNWVVARELPGLTEGSDRRE